MNTNELHHLKRCLPSVLGQRYEAYEVLLVDNASTDGSVEYVERAFPQIRVIQNRANLGYVGANNVGFMHAVGEYLAVLNPDTEVDADWLQELVVALERTPSSGLATSRILIMDDPQRVNSCGNEITFCGITVCRGFGKPPSAYDLPEAVSAVSGAAFAIKRPVLQRIGHLDDTFFIYYEDTDLSLRAALAGYDCIYVPTSIVYHDYAFRFSPNKCYLQERNRLACWLKVFRWGTLFLLLPTLVLGEVLAWGYALLRGREHLLAKARGYSWIIANRRKVMEARRETQALRRVGDRTLLRRMSHRLSFVGTSNEHVARILEAIVQPLLWLWGRICQVAVVW